jgi:hypothetical protein
VLVNCAWDYQDRHEEFLATLDATAALGVPVFNDPATVRWNIRKTYLKEFEAKGVKVIPTLWPEAPTAADIAEAMRVFGVDDVVLKRQVGRRGAGAGALYAGEPAGAGTCYGSAGDDPAFRAGDCERGGVLVPVRGWRVQPCAGEAAEGGGLPHPGGVWRQVAGD